MSALIQPTLARRSEVFVRNVNELTSIVEGFLRTGVALFERSNDDEKGDVNHQNQVALVRAIAVELKRPQIMATHNTKAEYAWDRSNNQYRPHERDFIQLAIPKQKRLEIIQVGLILASKAENPNTIDGKPGVFLRHRSSQSVYTFIGDEAQEVFHAWRKSCETDEVYRIALKLD